MQQGLVNQFRDMISDSMAKLQKVWQIYLEENSSPIELPQIQLSQTSCAPDKSEVEMLKTLVGNLKRQKRKNRVSKDSHAFSRPNNPFIYFFQEYKPKLMMDYPHIRPTAIIQLAAQKFRSLHRTEKAKYVKKYYNQKTQFLQEYQKPYHVEGEELGLPRIEKPVEEMSRKRAKRQMKQSKTKQKQETKFGKLNNLFETLQKQQ